MEELSFSVLLAEPNLLLKERIAGILARCSRVWCVAQVSLKSGLLEGAERLRPDFIVADLSLIRDPETVAALRKCANQSKIVALVDSWDEPYVKLAHRLKVDNIVEKGQLDEEILGKMLSPGFTERKADAAMREKKATNITWHEQQVSTADLENLHGHKGVTIWFTGLSASGKSTLANATAVELLKSKVTTFVLDGDNIRHGLNKDLGFSPEDRVENIRRIGEVAKLFTQAGIVNLTAFISPYIADRKIARDLQPETFIEVHLDTDIRTCEERDPKGAYKKAREGQIKNFTGIDAPYERPLNPEIRLDTGKMNIEQSVEKIIDYIRSRKII